MKATVGTPLREEQKSLTAFLQNKTEPKVLLHIICMLFNDFVINIHYYFTFRNSIVSKMNKNHNDYKN
jgi:hypothetical protein